MATPAEQVEQLETLLASGTTTIEYDGRRITRGDAEDILKRLRYFRDKETAAAGTSNSQSVASFTRD